MERHWLVFTTTPFPTIRSRYKAFIYNLDPGAGQFRWFILTPCRLLPTPTTVRAASYLSVIPAIILANRWNKQTYWQFPTGTDKTL